MMNKKLFLLGGHDLEMLTIKNILEKRNIKFIDKNLLWGAKLSDYKEHLNFDGTIYGIELDEDIFFPKSYIGIDHHGKNDYKLSSLEQVADILNIKLSRQEELIAANDSRYIKGMQSIGATESEIKKIRELDRQSQGITEKDELLAKESMEKSNTNIIFSKTEKFSTLSDIAYYKYNNYILFNNSKINFYGYEKNIILNFLYTKGLEENQIYYGGGDFGFVGIKANCLDSNDINNIIKEFQ